jgi:hypothetical protein
LASDLLPFPGQMRREGHLKSASLPGRLSSSGRALIVDPFTEVSRGTKTVSCGFHVDNLRFISESGHLPLSVLRRTLGDDVDDLKRHHDLAGLIDYLDERSDRAPVGL